MVLDYLEPLGVGALALAFEQLKNKLAAQGIFDQEVKKPLPYLPQRIAVITSPTGAAIHDFLKVILRRFANLEIIVVPVRVQGEEAASDMVKALHLVNRRLDVDVIVLTRGGGSLEDLWAYNQEELALAIRRSSIPVVSAVGHEIDLTICDLAADFSAPTPSAAAELLVTEKETLLNRLQEMRNRLLVACRLKLRNSLLELSRLRKGLRDPKKRLADAWMRLDEIHVGLMRRMHVILRDSRRRLQAEIRALLVHTPAKMVAPMTRQLSFQVYCLKTNVTSRIREQRMRLLFLEERLKDLSPLSVLKRGYSITRKLPEYIVLKETSGVKTGDRIHILLAEGELISRIERVGPDGKTP